MSLELIRAAFVLSPMPPKQFSTSSHVSLNFTKFLTHISGVPSTPTAKVKLTAYNRSSLNTPSSTRDPPYWLNPT